MKSFLQQKSNLIFLIILLAGAIMRFYGYGQFSLSNDELSALNRTHYSSLSQVLEHGVAELDNHPAGVQVFIYYWTKIAGTSETALRLPFVLTGILSVLLVYLLGKRWFGPLPGLFSASAMAIFKFPLLYSQIARPYSFGLFFTLAFSWFWTKVLFDEKHRSPFYLAGFILSGTLAFYTHYFAGLTVIITGLTGLFFLKKKNFLPYLLCGLGIAVLFLPHLNIFIRQISKGGLGWVSEPGIPFIKDYFSYALNDSWLISLFTGVLMVWGILKGKRPVFNKFNIPSILWFILPFLIGYIYSIINKPVLRDAVLLFSYPYFLLFLFSFLRGMKVQKSTLTLLLFFSLSTAYSTVYINKYYQTSHFGDFKGVAKSITDLRKKYGEEELLQFIQVVHPYYIHHYLPKDADSLAQYSIDSTKDFKKMRDILANSNKNYCMVAYINKHNPAELIELPREYYPHKMEHIKLGNMSGIQVFKRLGKRDDTVFKSINNFEKNLHGWDRDTTYYNNDMSYEGEKSQLLFGKKVYSSTLRMNVKDVFGNNGQFITASVMCNFPEKVGNSELVISFERDGESYDWHSAPAPVYIDSTHSWEKVFLARPLPEGARPGDKVLVYFWNEGKEKCYIDHFKVSVYSEKHYLDN